MEIITGGTLSVTVIVAAAVDDEIDYGIIIRKPPFDSIANEYE